MTNISRKAEITTVKAGANSTDDPYVCKEVAKHVEVLTKGLKEIGAVPTDKFTQLLEQIKRFDADPKDLKDYFDSEVENKQATELINNWGALSSEGHDSKQSQVKNKIRYFVSEVNGIKFRGLVILDGEIWDDFAKC